MEIQTFLLKNFPLLHAYFLQLAKFTFVSYPYVLSLNYNHTFNLTCFRVIEMTPHPFQCLFLCSYLIRVWSVLSRNGLKDTLDSYSPLVAGSAGVSDSNVSQAWAGILAQTALSALEQHLPTLVYKCRQP